MKQPFFLYDFPPSGGFLKMPQDESLPQPFLASGCLLIFPPEAEGYQSDKVMPPPVMFVTVTSIK